jgi:hypothetical protein
VTLRARSPSGRSRLIRDQKRTGVARIALVPILTRTREAAATRTGNPCSEAQLLGRAVESFMTGMRDTEKDRLTLSVVYRHSEFQETLGGNPRKYPTREFCLFAEAVRRYAEKTGSGEMMRRRHWRGRPRARRPSTDRTQAGTRRTARRGRKTGMSPFSRLRSALRWGRTNLLVFEDACPVFAQNPFSRLSSRIAGGMGCYRQESLNPWRQSGMYFLAARPRSVPPHSPK